MPKVRNAIILAAGRGSRLNELTENTPKPLLKPRDKIIIVDIIDKLIQKGITEIIVVTGYLSEQFDFLKDRVKLIKNDNWDKGNNSTSIQACMDYIGNSLIINGDIILKGNPFLKKYKSSLTYVEINEDIDEWYVETVGRQVMNFQKNGLGKSGYFQREIVFVTKKLSKMVKNRINDFNKDEYYEYLMINTANEFGIPFKVYEVDKNSIFDLDNNSEYNKYKES